jgi:pyruvate kinase
VHQTSRIVATLGPASWTLARDLRRAGATAFRLNASHLQPAELAAALERTRRESPDTDVVVDLQGAKTRLGRFEARPVAPGERLRFALDAREPTLPIPHQELFAQAHPGETISVDDGRVRLRVESTSEGAMEATALDAGRLHPRKGVNLVEHPVTLASLTAADREAIAAARSFGVSAFAFSFMADGREAAWVRQAAPGCRVIGKIERREASESLPAVAERVDELWICRGDLGAQLGLAALARFVASVNPTTLPVPVLMAGQVVEHLTRHRAPTRSEVCHLYDLAARGYAGCVLSDETAVGDDPVRAVSEAASLLRDFHSLYTAG